MARRSRLKALAATLALTFSAIGAATGAAQAREEITVFSGARPTVSWLQAIGERDAAPDEIDGISVTDDGTTIVAGVFRGSVTLAGQTFRSRGEGDVFLASIAPGGRYRWARAFGGPGDDNAFDVSTDAAGNIVVSGWFAGTVDFGGTSLRSRGGQDQFLAKYAPDGRLLWARGFGGPGGDGGNEVAVAPNGEIAVAAITDGDFEVDGRLFRFGGGKRDSLVLRLTPDGAVRWTVPVNGSGLERIRAMAMTSAGDVLVGFQYQGRLSMGGAALSSAGKWDGAVARLTPAGALAWLLPMGGAGQDGVRGVAATDDGQIYASGIVGGAANLAGLSVPRVGEATDYVLKITPNGKPVWILSFAGGGPSNNGGEVVANRAGLVVSTLVTGPMTIRRNRDVVATLEPRARGTTSLLMGFGHDGAPRFAFRPAPSGGGAGALGDVLSISPSGRYLAQAVRFRGRLGAAGTEIRTPSERDSAAVLLRLDGR